ncbi:IS110 family transposase [Asticcacaulis tiandongensis]|uniref:IS110 family transposase n=1 Tax=Asticcacaulis tiandongensis TaxID=2565365 RepID=UPI001C63F61D|nr:transposase [Asticcacaulis tiandongensis]
MKQIEPSTKVTGLDIGKDWLALGLCDGQTHLRFANTMAGIAELIRQVQERAIDEASGNYARDVREALEAARLEVVMLQPIEVRAFARWHRLRSKSDKADAYLIALAAKA